VVQSNQSANYLTRTVVPNWGAAAP